jgi:hypothetical protein
MLPQSNGVAKCYATGLGGKIIERSIITHEDISPKGVCVGVYIYMCVCVCIYIYMCVCVLNNSEAFRVFRYILSV